MLEINDIPEDPKNAASLIVKKMLDFLDVTAEKEKINHLNIIVHFMLNVHVENVMKDLMKQIETE